ncbi:hypothetical protein AJ80_04115 [Polytolypa hystricis UAMH7299]|uniref:Uncharacterized protein n=1 Tax=Polytolypa hystricis (strain UAMH7299) TaxID=1447883 RepID=A0A2B7YDI3_POLH7|nr:hypothetical protein AJ80_04115 [Polytolypa hystricis UAMH7299]
MALIYLREKLKNEGEMEAFIDFPETALGILSDSTCKLHSQITEFTSTLAKAYTMKHGKYMVPYQFETIAWKNASTVAHHGFGYLLDTCYLPRTWVWR